MPYREGQAFAVPLPSGDFGLGVIARMAPKGKLLLGYFFGPRKAYPDWQLWQLEPSVAAMVGRFGDLHLIDGKWKILGDMPNWDRTRWRTPEFIKRDPLHALPDEVVIYDDDDISKQPRWERRSSIPAGLSPYHGLMGAGFVEEKLEKLLPRS